MEKLVKSKEVWSLVFGFFLKVVYHILVWIVWSSVKMDEKSHFTKPYLLICRKVAVMAPRRVDVRIV